MPLKLYPPREGKTPNWSIRGTYLGVAVDRSARTADRAVAKRELARIQREIERGRYGERPAATFASAVVAYLKAGGDGRFMKPLLLHFRETPLTDIDQAAIDAAADALYPNAKPATRNRQVYTPVSAVLKRAGVEISVRRPAGHATGKRVEWLWPEEAEALLTACAEEDRELAVLVTVLIYTGLRVSEALSLVTRDLRMDEAFVYLPTSKNEEPRAVYLPAPALAALSAHPRGLARDGRVFRFTKGQRLYDRLKRAADAAGVPWFRFHHARHTFATWMRRYGGLDTRGLVGTGVWKDPKSAARYAHVVTTEEARRADLLPSPKARAK